MSHMSPMDSRMGGQGDEPPPGKLIVKSGPPFSLYFDI